MRKKAIAFMFSLFFFNVVSANSVHGYWTSDSIHQVLHWISGTDTTITNSSALYDKDLFYLKADGTGIIEVYDADYPDLPDEYEVTFSSTESMLIVNYPEDEYYETAAYSDSLDYIVNLDGSFQMHLTSTYDPCEEYSSISECSADYLDGEVDSFEKLLIVETTSYDRYYSVIINEFLAGSETSSTQSDFVEIYNYGSGALDISGWGFSAQSGSVATTAPSNTTVPSMSYYLLSFDDTDAFPSINANLNKMGGTIYIQDTDEDLVFKYDFGTQEDGISSGVFSGNMVSMTPSPGLVNTELILSTDGKNNIAGLLPSSYKLNQNYPNPFNPSTNISFSLPVDDLVNVSIYNMLGKKVMTLMNNSLKAGKYSLKWNATDHSGINVPAGVYIYRINTKKFEQSKKMILLK